MASAVEFVEGGVQDACEDACSICLETFSDKDPASVTECNHEYHLQCILEWSQRSTGCPMCWQPLSLQDASSQGLLASMEQERLLRQDHIQASLLSRHRSSNHEFHQFPESLEERLMQHFAAAVSQSPALARGNHRPSVGGQRPSQFLIFPTYSTAASSGSTGQDESLSATSIARPVEKEEVGTSHGQRRNAAAVITDLKHGESDMQSHSARERASSEPASTSLYGSTTSDLHSFSDSIKSRLAAVSSRYKESFTKTTRIFRERLRVRSGATQDAKVGTPEGSSSFMGVDPSGCREEIHTEEATEPRPDVTGAHGQIAEEALTDTNLFQVSNGQKHEDSINSEDPCAAETSQPIADEARVDSCDVTVRTGNEGAELHDENKSIFSAT